MTDDYKDDNLWLMQGDCLERMKEIPEGSVDMILCDPPYGTTACKWDSVIPLDKMWIELKRVIKPYGAIVLFGSQPFTSVLISSNLSMYKYNWIWEKERPSNFFAAKFMALNNTEDICVFSTGGCNNGSKSPMYYNPQGTTTIDRKAKNSNTGGKISSEHKTSVNDGRIYHQTTTNYPKKIIKFLNDEGTVHPTQKPVALMEYLIKTYTNEQDSVLDFTMGSFTTAVAALNTNRKFIGIERDADYFNIGVNRVKGVLSAKI